LKILVSKRHVNKKRHGGKKPGFGFPRWEKKEGELGLDTPRGYIYLSIQLPVTGKLRQQQQEGYGGKWENGGVFVEKDMNFKILLKRNFL